MSLKRIIEDCERMIAKYYGFGVSMSFFDFIVPKNSVPFESGQTRDQLTSGVFVLENPKDDEVFIGACLDDAVTAQLIELNPLERLTIENLNAFCVLLEEISHFHLLVNRAHAELGVSKVELEWQAEVDKLLFSSELLRSQSGKSHILPLLKLIFDHAEFNVSSERQLYLEANKLAANFWYKAVSEYRDPTSVEDIRATLQKLYRVDWEEKRAYCAR